MAGHILAHLGYNLEREAVQLGLKVIVAGEEIAIHFQLLVPTVRKPQLYDGRALVEKIWATQKLIPQKSI